MSENLNKLIVNVNSSERVSGTNTSFILNPTLSSFPPVRSVQILSCEIVNSFTNITLTTNNLKIRLVDVRNIVSSPNNLMPPRNVLIDINIPAPQNYTWQTLVSAIQLACDNFFATNSTPFASNPLTFSINEVNYRFTISLNSSSWGFYLPKSALGTVLGYTNLVDESYMNGYNINSTNNSLNVVVCSNIPGQSGNYVYPNVTITDLNKYLMFDFSKQTGTQISTYRYMCVVPVGTYSFSGLVSIINSQIASQDTTFKALSSFPTTINQQVIYEPLWSNGSITMSWINNKFRFACNNLQASLNVQSFRFNAPFSKNLIDSISANFPATIFTGNSVLVESNILATVNESYMTTVPAGYYGVQSIKDGLNAILTNLVGKSGLTYDPNSNVISCNFGKIGILDSSSFAKVLSLPMIPSSSANTIASGVSADSPSVATSFNVNIVLNPISLFASLISQSLVNLRGVDCTYLHSSLAAPGIDGKGNISRCLLKIPLTSQIGQTTFWQNYSPYLYRYACSLQDTISFELKDSSGKVLPDYGLNWSMTLCYYFDS